jgi:hypothetical protein
MTTMAILSQEAVQVGIDCHGNLSIIQYPADGDEPVTVSVTFSNIQALVDAIEQEKRTFTNTLTNA